MSIYAPNSIISSSGSVLQQANEFLKHAQSETGTVTSFLDYENNFIDSIDGRYNDNDYEYLLRHHENMRNKIAVLLPRTQELVQQLRQADHEHASYFEASLNRVHTTIEQSLAKLDDNWDMLTE